MLIKRRPNKTKPSSVARPLLAGFFALSAALMPAFAEAASDFDTGAVVKVTRAQQAISLGLNKSKVIDLPADAHDILVANPIVADAVTRTARRIYIFGKQVGQTNVFVFDSQGREIAVLDLVIERDITGLEATIRKYIKDAEVKVEILNDNVVLTGSVQTPQDAAKAVQLAQIYLTGGEATTNQFTQSASTSGSGTAVVIGGDDEDRRKSQIVNLLQIQGEDQVTLKVTVAEVQRSVVKQLGFNTDVSTAIDGIGITSLGDNPFGFGRAFGDVGTNIGNLAQNDVNSQLNALEQAGVMRTLAEPSLTAISGEQASFKVGGEFKISEGKTESEDGVEYSSRDVEYGIGLDFTPVVLSPGRISLKIRTSVSEPTFESPYIIPARGVPSAGYAGLRKRLADTTVELPSGGSLVIAGLVRDEMRQVISGFPGLSKVPVLGTLFRSRDFQRYETELVIIVTPYLVRPVARKDLARPDDGLNFSSDGAGNFLGRINRVYGAMETDLPPGRYHGVVGYIYK